MHAVQFSNLSRSDGSALVSLGETVIQAAVYGPTEIKVSKELCDKAVVEVTFKPKVGQSDSKERSMEFFIRNAIESVILTTMHPRTSINIILQEIQDSGNMLACSVNAAYLALLDAGIPMKGLVAASSVAFIDDKIIPYPSVKELKLSQKTCTVCFENRCQTIVGLKCSSFVSAEELKKTIEITKKSSVELFEYFREVASKRYKRGSNSRSK